MPDNLLLLTADNFQDQTFFELQMEKHSVSAEKYKVVKFNKEKTTPWNNFLKWKRILKHIESQKTEGKEYVLYCDSSDVLFVDSPHNILNNFLSYFNCDLLYNSTNYDKGYMWDKYDEGAVEHNLYKRNKFTYISRRIGRQCNLNAGLFIGRIDFVINVYKDMLSHEPRLKEITTKCKSDQQVLRCMEHKYYPRLQIDGFQQLIARCDKIGDLWSVDRIDQRWE
ncbi:hypothetical protein CMI37_22190 [Candidatus Pacearchaeota archaeon]|nr:hypothetical protein [Candidatus Pacearchaeota archaeon]